MNIRDIAVCSICAIILHCPFSAAAEEIKDSAETIYALEASAHSQVNPEIIMGPVQPSDPDAFVISRKTDLMLSCEDLRKEVSSMGQIITDTAKIKNVSSLQSKGISAAGAVGSLVVGTVTGGIGLALGGLVLDQSVSTTENNADELQDIAKQRRTWIKGLYTAQACEGPIETPQQEQQLEALNHSQSVLEKISHIEPASGEYTKKIYGPERQQTSLNKRYND